MQDDQEEHCLLNHQLYKQLVYQKVRDLERNNQDHLHLQQKLLKLQNPTLETQEL